VWLNPLGGVLIAGPGGANLYYKGLLDKVGVTANVYRAGTFKAAVEPFTRTDMSPEARQANEAIARSLWENWVTEVRTARGKAQVLPYAAAPVEQIARANGDLAQAALNAGLVDKLGDRTAYGKRLAELGGVLDEDVPGSFRAIKFDQWVAANPVPKGGRIGVVTVAGNIVDGEAGPGTAGADTIAEHIRKGLKDKDLAALVVASTLRRLDHGVRTDPPGGARCQVDRHPGRDLDGLGRGERRLLDRDGRRRDLRRA
jgi:protease-4